MKKNVIRLLSLFMVMFTMSLPSQASSDWLASIWDTIQNAIDNIQQSNRYHSVVYLNPVGEGKVYASYGTTEITPSNTDWSAEEFVASTPNNGESRSGNQNWCLYAQANDGYKFVGWYNNESCSGNVLSTETTYKVSVSSVHGNEIKETTSPGIHHYYAKFAPTVTIGSLQYTTYVAPVAVSFPSEVTAFIVTDATSSNVTMEEVTSVPAGTAVVLKGSASTYVLTTVATSTDDVTSNLLKASDGTVVGDGSIYVLANKSKGVGFYPMATGYEVPKGKAYLQISSGAKEFYGFEGGDDATGIETIENAVEDGAIYNMAGQRLQKMQKGINIVNGKKILKK